MKHTKTPLVVGNWKMNPTTLAAAKQLFMDVRKAVRKIDDVMTVVAPPLVFLSDVSRLSPSGRVPLSAQNIWHEASGAQTGEVSAPMIASAGATYTIIGHSERRANGETDEVVAAKMAAAHKCKLIPILCVGEVVRDEGGQYFSDIETQLKHALAQRKKAEVARTVVAYEPIWAIGSGKTPSGADIYEMRLFIEKCVTKLFDRTTARKMTILYGGSVNADNAAELFREGDVHGFLVGGASLQADSFAGICKAVRSVRT